MTVAASQSKKVDRKQILDGVSAFCAHNALYTVEQRMCYILEPMKVVYLLSTGIWQTIVGRRKWRPGFQWEWKLLAYALASTK